MQFGFDDDLIQEEKLERQVVIIKGVAGTGKSTLLSHFYDEIKNKEPNIWVIRFDLKEHFDDAAKYEGKQILSVSNHHVISSFRLIKTDLTDAIDFFLGLPNIVDIKSSFVRSLLRHRLEKGGRIVLLLDGFDEMNDQACQEKATRLMKAIIVKKSTRLYVTTRPDAADNLQLQLGQLAYTLIDFSAEDQVKYLTSFWADKLDAIGDRENSRIQDIARFLVNRVSQDLKDDEKSFVGVPLHCRILAEFFLPQVENDIDFTRKGTGDRTRDVSYIIGKEKSYLFRLYRKLMDTKREICRKEIAAIQIPVEWMEVALEQVEKNQTRLAIQTIVSDEKEVETLWPTNPHLLVWNRGQQQLFDKLVFRFGLVDRVNGRSEFTHRTYAEYLMAEYLFQGFQLGDDKRDMMLDKESVPQLITHKVLLKLSPQILLKDEYSGVRIFLDVMLENN